MPVTVQETAGYYRFKAAGNLQKPFETECEKAQWMSLLKSFPSKHCRAGLQLLPYTHSVMWYDFKVLRSYSGPKQYKGWQQTTVQLKRDQIYRTSVLQALHDHRNMLSWNKSGLLSLNEACCHATKLTASEIVGKYHRARKDKGLRKIKGSFIVKEWSRAPIII